MAVEFNFQGIKLFYLVSEILDFNLMFFSEFSLGLFMS